jgi:hypothetical protein
MQDAVKPVTHWLVLDPGKHSGMLASAMAFLLSGDASTSRVAMVFWPSTGHGSSSALHRFLHTVSSLTSRADKLPAFLLSLTNDTALWQALASDQEDAMALAVASAKAAGLNEVMLEKALQHDTDNFKACATLRHYQVFRCCMVCAFSAA